MKFGKEFQQILDDSAFPDEWKSSAIEYRRLKKLIKDVVSELSSMGLSPDVLHRLLATDGQDSPGSPPEDIEPNAIGSSSTGKRGSVDRQSAVTVQHEGEEEVLEFEFESDESPPTFGGPSRVGAIAAGASSSGSLARPSGTHPDPLLDDSFAIADDESSQVGRSVDSTSSAHLSNPRNFRVRLLSDQHGGVNRGANAEASGSRSPSGDGGGAFGSSTLAHGRASTAPMLIRPIGVADAMRSTAGGDQEDLAGSLGSMRLGGERTLSAEEGSRHRRTVRRSMNEGGVKAQYVFAGDSSHPEPQLRFHLPAASPIQPLDRSTSPSPSGTSDSVTDIDADEDDEDDDLLDRLPIPAPIQLSRRSTVTSPSTIRATRKSPFLVPSISVSSPSIPASPTLQRMNMVKSPIYALAAGSPEEDGLKDLSLGESAVDTPRNQGTGLDDEAPDGSIPTIQSSTSIARPITNGHDPSIHNSVTALSSSPTDPTHAARPPRERDIIVPLASDKAFFDLLTAALTSLSAFHASQQEEFRQSVDRLCRMISDSIVPQGNSVQVMPIPPLPSSGVRSASVSAAIPYSYSQSNSHSSSYSGGTPRHPSELMMTRRITKMHKKDLYAWREIFTLWIEAEIFESSAERTRGERTVDQAEARLQKFASEVVKRGLGDRRTFRGKKTREAWEEFLRLNVLLLDLKRFQLANINAARKILKKHDKRTALTASTGFQTLARTTLRNVGADGSVSTWTFYHTSLPHVLLASLTDILLPILPSLDDYACLICTSIAFKPIRLSCQHLFCVRCLVKMQRAGQAECPLCRSAVVLLADKSSLDVQVMEFMRDWFPREIKAKQRENDEEIADEIRAEQRGQEDGCVVM